MPKPTKEEIENAMDMAEDMDLSDGAYWAMVHELLGLEYGSELFDLIVEYGLGEKHE